MLGVNLFSDDDRCQTQITRNKMSDKKILGIVQLFNCLSSVFILFITWTSWLVVLMKVTKRTNVQPLKMWSVIQAKRNKYNVMWELMVWPFVDLKCWMRDEYVQSTLHLNENYIFNRIYAHYIYFCMYKRKPLFSSLYTEQQLSHVHMYISRIWINK